jgi:hypothetical protein
MAFAAYRHWAKAISDILQNTWKEVTILSFLGINFGRGAVWPWRSAQTRFTPIPRALHSEYLDQLPREKERWLLGFEQFGAVFGRKFQSLLLERGLAGRVQLRRRRGAIHQTDAELRE